MMPSMTWRKPSTACGAGLAIGLGDALALVLGELALELDALRRQLQQALAAVAVAGVLHDEALAHELAQHARQALLGDAQDGQQVAHAHLRMAADEIDHAVMRPAEAVARQHRVGLGGEIAIGEIEQLDALAQLVLAQAGRAVAVFMSAMLTYFSRLVENAWSRVEKSDIMTRNAAEARGTLTWHL